MRTLFCKAFLDVIPVYDVMVSPQRWVSSLSYHFFFPYLHVFCTVDPLPMAEVCYKLMHLLLQCNEQVTFQRKPKHITKVNCHWIVIEKAAPGKADDCFLCLC